MNKLHLSQARQMLNSRQRCKLSVWTKKGEIQTYDCVSLKTKPDGTRNVKLVNSGQIRKVRDVCIFMINDIEVFI